MSRFDPRSSAPPPAPATRKQYVCFRVGGEEYGIDIMRVREVVPPLPVTPVADAPPFVEGVAELRGDFLGVVDLRKRLGKRVDPERPAVGEAAAGRHKYVVVDLGARRFGLVVDEVTEVCSVDPDGVAALADAVPGDPERRFLTGVASLGRGVILILDVDRVLAAD